MTYKFLPFVSISLIVFSMALLLYATHNKWITIIAVINGIAGLIALNVIHYRVLNRLLKHDKEYFDKSF